MIPERDPQRGSNLMKEDVNIKAIKVPLLTSQLCLAGALSAVGLSCSTGLSLCGL